LRVGLVCPYAWDIPGGVQAHILDLAETLQGMGHEVSVLTPAEDPESLPAYAVYGGRPRAVPYNGSVARLTMGVQATNRVRKWIREGEFDVVHVHEPLAPSLSLLACWVGRGPIVATWHSSVERSRALTVGYYIAQTAMEKVSARIAVSEHARRTLVDHIGGDAVLIPNGVRVDDFADASPLCAWAGPRILFLGRATEPRKGFDVLAGALDELFTRHPTLGLVVVGPASREEVLASIDPRWHDRVETLGRLSDHDKARALRSVDIYVAPNTGGESFGIVLLEAMAARVPVLASDLPAFTQVLDDGRAGMSFAVGDSASLAAGVDRLLADPALRQSMAVEGERRARHFDWSRIAREIVDVYESVAVTGESVQVDLRGQLVGRLARRGGSGADE
jgi:phosphatidyl-myo-inositol alpha-mannosyltransferase